MAERESAGESLWNESFSDRVRTRILHAFRLYFDGAVTAYPGLVLGAARQVILGQEGLFSLAGDGGDAASDFLQYFGTCPDDMFPTVIESLIPELDRADELENRYMSWPQGWARSFTADVNEVFAQERVGWEVIDGRMVEIHSKELHAAAVEPALRLLHLLEFAKADKQYRDALDELAQGKAADAITDAGATLQEVLEGLGCEGNQLGDLTRSARKKGLLGAHDTPLVDAVERTMHWVAADRSEMGDTHHATQATRDDAWLVVHVVGALIVRLATGRQRVK